MIRDLLTAFGLVFLAELPDKTMFATLLLATRLQRRSAVWSGVTVAYSLHVIVAVLVGGLLSKLPSEPVRYTVGAVFVIAGVFLISSSRRVRTNDNADSEPQSLPSWRSAFMMSVATVGVAEFADLTQLTTASLAATRQSPVAVAIGAACALAAVAGLAVGLGHVLVKRVRMHLIQRAAGTLFVVLGALSFV
jgi:putative Ca2+/H+ antiporter (TMEM165/GDT1 family)